MSIDAYTLHLLGMAVEACSMKGYDLTIPATGEPLTYWRQMSGGLGSETVQRYGSRSKQLAALLRDLGVEVPERPTADDVRSMSDLRGRGQGQFSLAEDLGHLAKVIPLARLREWYARDRLAVLALLEEGS